MVGSQNPSPDEKNPGKFRAIRQLADTTSRDALNTYSKGPRPSCDMKNLAENLHSFQPAKMTSRDVFWEGRTVPTKSLFEQEAPKIGTQKCSTKRGVRESCM